MTLWPMKAAREAGGVRLGGDRRLVEGLADDKLHVLVRKFWALDEQHNQNAVTI